MAIFQHFEKSRLLASAAYVSVAIGAAPALAADYYVSAPIVPIETGKGTQASPFHTFYAPMKVLVPGDTLHVMPGTYSGMYISVSGSASGGPINIVGDPGNRPTIYTTSGNAIQIKTGMSYLNISGFEAQSTALNKNGVFLETTIPVHHITLDHIYAHDNSCAGINAMRADYITVRNSIIANNSLLSPLGCSGIDFYQFTNVDNAPGIHNVISNNTVYGNQNTVLPPGYTVVTDGNGIILDDFDHTQLGYLSSAPAYTGTTLVENNVVYNNGGRGIHVYFTNNVIVRNNTTYHDEMTPGYATLKYAEIEALNASNVQIYNNIMYPLRTTDYAVWIGTATNVTADYNVYYGGLGARVQTSTGPLWGSNNKWGDPAFSNPDITNPSTADFHVKSGSAAVNTGLANAVVPGPSNDLPGAQRPNAGTITAGAIQNPQ